MDPFEKCSKRGIEHLLEDGEHEVKGRIKAEIASVCVRVCVQVCAKGDVEKGVFSEAQKTMPYLDAVN